MNNEYSGAEEQIKYFCDNVELRHTSEYFQLHVESGNTSLIFTMSPEHAKRLVLALAHHVADFELNHRTLNTTWAPKIASPYASERTEVSERHSDSDALFDAARAVVVRSRRASAIYLKRKLGIDYARASRLIDLLEERGVIAPSDGSENRKVLAKAERRKK